MCCNNKQKQYLYIVCRDYCIYVYIWVFDQFLTCWTKSTMHIATIVVFNTHLINRKMYISRMYIISATNIFTIHYVLYVLYMFQYFPMTGMYEYHLFCIQWIVTMTIMIIIKNNNKYVVVYCSTKSYSICCFYLSKKNILTKTCSTILS